MTTLKYIQDLFYDFSDIKTEFESLENSIGIKTQFIKLYLIDFIRNDCEEISVFFHQETLDGKNIKFHQNSKKEFCFHFDGVEHLIPQVQIKNKKEDFLHLYNEINKNGCDFQKYDYICLFKKMTDESYIEKANLGEKLLEQIRGDISKDFPMFEIEKPDREVKIGVDIEQIVKQQNDTMYEIKVNNIKQTADLVKSVINEEDITSKTDLFTTIEKVIELDKNSIDKSRKFEIEIPIIYEISANFSTCKLKLHNSFNENLYYKFKLHDIGFYVNEPTGIISPLQTKYIEIGVIWLDVDINILEFTKFTLRFSLGRKLFTQFIEINEYLSLSKRNLKKNKIHELQLQFKVTDTQGKLLDYKN